VGEHFVQAAQLATEFQYWDAAGVLLVHFAIAVTDALTIKVGGVKSAGLDRPGVLPACSALLCSC
jgi:hypothetical protein